MQCPEAAWVSPTLHVVTEPFGSFFLNCVYLQSLNFQLQLVLYIADSRVGLHKSTETSNALLHWTSFSCIRNVKVNQTAASTCALSNELPELVREFLYSVTGAS